MPQNDDTNWAHKNTPPTKKGIQNANSHTTRMLDNIETEYMQAYSDSGGGNTIFYELQQVAKSMEVELATCMLFSDLYLLYLFLPYTDVY